MTLKRTQCARICVSIIRTEQYVSAHYVSERQVLNIDLKTLLQVQTSDNVCCRQRRDVLSYTFVTLPLYYTRTCMVTCKIKTKFHRNVLPSTAYG